jgi:TonB family protein
MRLPRVARDGMPVFALLVLACSGKDDGTVRIMAGGGTGAAPDAAEQAPVAVNPVSPVEYPRALLEQGIEGRVLLRLYADSQGKLIPDSTRVAESSGYPAFDSAAVAGAPALRFSPAIRRGRPVAGPFLQPVHFRNPRSRSAAQ